MMEKFDANEDYEIVNIAGNNYLFANYRIDRDSVPDGLYAYDIGDACDGCFARVSPNVIVNHWGTIIGKEQIPLGEDGTYYPEYGSEEYEGVYFGTMTLDEYMEAEFDNIVDRTASEEYLTLEGKKYLVVVEMDDTYNLQDLNMYYGNVEDETMYADKYSFTLTPIETIRREEVKDIIFGCFEEINAKATNIYIKAYCPKNVNKIIMFMEEKKKVMLRKYPDVKLSPLTYANGNDGTDFDWSVNDRLCEFIYDLPNGWNAMKMLLDRKGTATVYYYPNGEMMPVEQETERLIDECEMEQVAALFYESIDKKNIWNPRMQDVEW